LNKSITINPPSCTLHVSSLKRDYCRVDVLRQAFEKFGRVEKVELLNHCAEKNMALVKFASLQESFEAISEMHGRHLGGRKMQISFTKSKLSS
jgi:RNA recognition motif-containing protein